MSGGQRLLGNKSLRGTCRNCCSSFNEVAGSVIHKSENGRLVRFRKTGQVGVGCVHVFETTKCIFMSAIKTTKTNIRTKQNSVALLASCPDSQKGFLEKWTH